MTQKMDPFWLLKNPNTNAKLLFFLFISLVCSGYILYAFHRYSPTSSPPKASFITPSGCAVSVNGNNIEPRGERPKNASVQTYPVIELKDGRNVIAVSETSGAHLEFVVERQTGDRVKVYQYWNNQLMEF